MSKVVSLTVFISAILIRAEYVDQALVDYYLELIENRTQASQNVEYPDDARLHEPTNKTVEDYGEFDFIVIGAGSTGCIIANRLSEVKKWKVLLLEAGPFPDEELLRIPGLSYLDEQTKFNWRYRTVPQKNICLNNEDARCSLSRGKGIGGTSLINGLMYVRGGKLDYRLWSDLLKDASYRYENLLPYFKRTERFRQRNPILPADWEYHGKKGGLHTLQSDLITDLERAILRGSQELGYQIVDYNGRQALGASVAQYYIKNGRRDDPGLAFISSAKQRKSLIVLDGSYVVKLGINNGTKRVDGVIFTKNNKTYMAKARKEVILSAGAIGSPQILLLSGIGPEEHLQSVGIPVVENLPVGQTLRDKIYTVIPFSSNVTTVVPVNEQSVREFLKERGPLTTGHSCNAYTWFKIPTGSIRSRPDIEIHVIDSRSSGSSGTFSVACQIVNTNSIGSITLSSSDPFQYPLIDTNYLGDGRDLELAYDASQVVLQLFETNTLRKLNGGPTLIPAAECNNTVPNSREFWLCSLKASAVPGNHLSSTCLTGTSPKNGVVDQHFKVFGMKNLRVADASVIPFPLANHPTATCSVIAEKLSEEIKNEYGAFN